MPLRQHVTVLQLLQKCQRDSGGQSVKICLWPLSSESAIMADILVMKSCVAEENSFLDRAEEGATSKGATSKGAKENSEE